MRSPSGTWSSRFAALLILPLSLLSGDVLWGMTFRVPTATIKAQWMMSRSLYELQNGQQAAGASRLRDLNELLSTHPTLRIPDVQARVSSLHDLARRADARSQALDERSPLRRLHAELLRQVDPLHDLMHSEPNRPDAGVLTRDPNWMSSVQGVTALAVAPSVHGFSVDFLRGAAAPQAAFVQEVARPATDLTNTVLLLRWQGKPAAKRIFVTGARSDAPTVEWIRHRFEPVGYEVFFYQDCRPLCHEATVGAFFGTAGTVIHLLSEDAARSPYVSVEVAMIDRMVRRQDSVLVLSQQGAARLARAQEDGFTLENGQVCRAAQLRQDVPSC